MNSIKIAFFSDTHLREDLVFRSDVDLFIHCGDLLNEGTAEELDRAVTYFKSNLKGKRMLFTPGNHDNTIEKNTDLAARTLKEAGIELFINERLNIEINGTKLSAYFMPFVPFISDDHAFNLNEPEMKKEVDKIPEDIDLLITHGPPSCVLDVGHYDKSFGCDLLLDKISKIKSLKVHAFGHVHESRGYLYSEMSDLLFLNASNAISNKPIVVEYPSLSILK